MSKSIAPLFLFAAALLGSAEPAHAAGDQVHIGQNVRIAAGEEASDVVCIFCNVEVEGRVTGDIVTVFGNLRLIGDAQHDVVTIFGAMKAEDNSSIEGDLASVFGVVRLGENVTVGKDMSAVFCDVHQAASVVVRGDRTYLPGIVLVAPLGILLLIILLLVREIRAYRQRVALRHFPSEHGR